MARNIFDNNGMFNRNRQSVFPINEKKDMTQIQPGMTPEQMATVMSNKILEALRKELNKPIPQTSESK